MPLLTIEELTVVYQSRGVLVRAVDGVSVTVEPGEILALVGESGCGKTSVALAITRLLQMPPATLSGRVMLKGVNVLDAPEPVLRTIRGGTIAYVFQDPGTSLNPVLTIGAQLIEVITHHTEHRGAAATRVAVEWLERVGMPSAAQRLGAYPHEFSGGMQQRVMLAMALAARPSLLIADEPTSALDVTVQIHILRLLRDLQRGLGLAVLLISHDLTVVERIAHRIGVMSAGELVELGATRQVLQQPAHPATKALIRYRSMFTLRRGA
ncbi:MAG: ABC transporter ATP-binding protein [Candidatus Omnitrophica bacterium]|nr:ABC transporter ATP-binding protein [Candidatus Omnitrophota bacterium]